MKTLFSALALVVAAPVAAQSAPAADPHAAHKQSGEHKEHGGKQDMDCCKMPCCAKMKAQAKGEKKGCCAEAGKKPSGPEADRHADQHADQHAGQHEGH